MTSKEQAEELINKCALEAARFDNTLGGNEQHIALELHYIIPLTELLEVAKAADWAHSLGRPHGSSHTYPDGCECEACECWDKLDKELQALRATGKIEL